MKRIRQILGSDRSASTDAGFTLVEVIVAMVVFSIIAISVAGAITNSLVVTRDARSRSVAQNLASQDLDQARAVADVFAVQSATTTTTVQGTPYTLTRTVEWQSSTTTATACGTGTGALQYKVVSDSITWPGASAPVTSSTILAPNTRINDPSLGTVVVAVQGAYGAGVSGVSVSIAPASTPNGASALSAQPALTDANGCTYALKVTPGNYNVTISMANGIDITEAVSPLPSKQVTVTAGTTSPLSIIFDTAAQLNLKYASNYNGSAILPSNLPVTFSNTRMASPYSPALNGATSLSLFPFQDGYTFEAGTYVPTGGSAKSCVDVDPGAWTTANSSGKTGVSSYATTASGSSNPIANVRMGVVTLPAMSNALGALTGGVIPITATSINSSASGDPGCQTGVTYTFNSSAGTPTIALPFGTYKIYAGTGLSQVSVSSSGIKTGGTVNSDGSVTLDPRGINP